MAMPFEDPSIFADFEVKEGDVFVSTGVKEGTTWTCYIAQQLTSHGKDDFEYLLQVVPWPEYKKYPEQPIEERKLEIKNMPHDQRRVFKTHCYPPALPLDPRAKYLVCVRNPADTIDSTFPFINSKTREFNHMWYNLPLDPPFVFTWEFYSEVLFNQVGFDFYWPLINSWWPHRNDKNVLLFHFTDLKKKPTETIRKISEFLGTDLSEDFIQLVVARSSFANMKKNENRFEAMFAGKNNEILMLNPGSFVRKGEVGGEKATPPEFAAKYRQLCESRCLNKEQLAWCDNGGELPK